MKDGAWDLGSLTWRRVAEGLEHDGAAASSHHYDMGSDGSGAHGLAESGGGLCLKKVRWHLALLLGLPPRHQLRQQATRLGCAESHCCGHEG